VLFQPRREVCLGDSGGRWWRRLLGQLRRRQAGSPFQTERNPGRRPALSRSEVPFLICAVSPNRSLIRKGQSLASMRGSVQGAANIAKESTPFSHSQRLLPNHIETRGDAVRVMDEEYEPSSPICAVSKTCGGLANSGSFNGAAAAYQALVRLVGSSLSGMGTVYFGHCTYLLSVAAQHPRSRNCCYSSLARMLDRRARIGCRNLQLACLYRAWTTKPSMMQPNEAPILASSAK
jgi:hypothetical protein